MINIEHLEYSELKAAYAIIAEREQRMEQEALYTLQHHAIRHSIRLFFAAIGFKIPDPEIEPDYPDTEDETEHATA